MEEFSLNSKYFANTSLIADISNTYRDKKFSIVVNNSFTIEIPEIVAASFSNSVTQLLQVDQTATELCIDIESKKNISSTLEKIRKVIVSRATVSIEEDEIDIFGEFGLKVGNEDFVHPFNEKLNKESKTLKKGNVLDVLTAKRKFGNTNIAAEVKFIANNFETMSKSGEFMTYASNTDNIDTVEEILSSNEMKLDSEDTLLSFLILVCKSNNNTSLFRLFRHVLMEYCTAECCKEFIEFVNDVIETPEVRTLISCIGRRFTQQKIPLSPSFVKGRHTKQIEEINASDPLNGILRREFQKGNALIDSCPPESGDSIDNLFDGRNDTYFYSKQENAFIKASLKDGKTFVIKNYTIRGIHYDNYCQIKNWKLEGERYSDGKWILIDQHNEDPFNTSQIRTFDVSCNERLKSVKLTHVGKRVDGCFGLNIAAFDIFGSLYTKQ